MPHLLNEIRLIERRDQDCLEFTVALAKRGEWTDERKRNLCFQI
jgi:hypothetical protein